VLSAANWGHDVHTRGNFERRARVSSEHKWLEVHGLEHFAEFYTDYGVALQKRFFGHFLAGEDTGWDQQPLVQLNVRHVDGSFELRAEHNWPLARTEWTTLHLDPRSRTLTDEPVAAGASAEFEALGEGLTFTTAPFVADTEITGPAAPGSSSPRRPPTPTSSSRCASWTPTTRTSPLSARWTPPASSVWAGCARHTARPIPSAACPTARGTPTIGRNH
jgi:hypothetical protein